MVPVFAFRAWNVHVTLIFSTLWRLAGLSAVITTHQQMLFVGEFGTWLMHMHIDNVLETFEQNTLTGIIIRFFFHVVTSAGGWAWRDVLGGDVGRAEEGSFSHKKTGEGEVLQPQVQTPCVFFDYE